MNAAEIMRLSYADYLALEASTDARHQYVDGVAYAMADGDPDHARVATNMLLALGAMLHVGRCLVYNSDLKLRVPGTGNAYYADATVVCGKLERHPGDHLAATNPSLLVEVLSPSTATFDRGDKFVDYQRFPSLRHYVLVFMTAKRVEHYRRNDDGTWTCSLILPGGAVTLPDLGGSVLVGDLYVGEDEALGP